MSRCPEQKGAGATLSCCRLTAHDDTGTEDGGHCWHWSARLHGVGKPHTIVTRAAGGYPLTCERGATLDGA